MPTNNDMKIMYMKDGSRVVVERELSDGYLVRKITKQNVADEAYQVILEDVVGGEIIFVPEAALQLLAPPEPYNEEIAELKDTISQLEARVSSLTEQESSLLVKVGKLADENSKTIQRLSFRHRALEKLEALWDGKITHFVAVSRWNKHIIEIQTFEGAIVEGEGHRKELRCLTLFSKDAPEQEPVRWGVSRTPNSDADSDYYPATSIEEAREIAQAMVVNLSEKLSPKLSENFYNNQNPNYLYESAKRCGVVPREDLVTQIEKIRADAKKKYEDDKIRSLISDIPTEKIREALRLKEEKEKATKQEEKV